MKIPHSALFFDRKNVQRCAKHLFWIGRLPLTRAAYRQAHWLGHSNGAAGGVQSTRLLGGSTALTLVCRLSASSLAGTFKRCRRRGAKHPFLGRLNCADACLPPTPPLQLERSNGAAGAFLRLIGLPGLIGQRLTEWQTFFLLIFCGAAPALRFSG